MTEGLVNFFYIRLRGVGHQVTGNCHMSMKHSEIVTAVPNFCSIKSVIFVKWTLLFLRSAASLSQNFVTILDHGLEMVLK